MLQPNDLSTVASQCAQAAYVKQAQPIDPNRVRLFYAKLSRIYARLAFSDPERVVRHPLLVDQIAIEPMRQLEGALASHGLQKFGQLARGGGALVFDCLEAPVVLRVSVHPPLPTQGAEGLLLPSMDWPLDQTTSKPPLYVSVSPKLPTLNTLLNTGAVTFEQAMQIARAVRQEALRRGFYPVDLDIDGFTHDTTTPEVDRVLGNIGLLLDGTPVVVDHDSLETLEQAKLPAKGDTAVYTAERHQYLDSVVAKHAQMAQPFEWKTPTGEWKTAQFLEKVASQLPKTQLTR
ncbi:MAG: hypothetical protein K2Q12_00575 [Rickettsiales bacterium]|nr:hypothetical protein [Rickettsiales bacterium]